MSSRWSEFVRHAFAFRLGAWYTALFIVSAMALSMLTYLQVGSTLAARDHDVLENTLSRYAGEFQRTGLPGMRAVIDDDASQGQHERLLIRVVSAERELVYFATPPGWSGFDLSRLDEPAARQAGWIQIDSSPDGAVLEVGSLTLHEGVTIQVGRSSHVRDELLRRFRDSVLEIMVLIVIIAVGGGAVLTYAGLSPLRALKATVQSILDTGRFDARVTARASRDPLDELGGQVNTMLERIQTLLAGMRGALDNVAHDLRTPLTRFRNVAESALVAEDPQAMREGLAQALVEADRVNATLTALMDISEAETGTMALACASAPLAAIVDEAIALYEDEADERGVALASSVSPTVDVWADRTRVRQVVANLIENAVKYTEPGGRIDVSAVAQAGEVTMTVADTGIGIPESALPFVWDRLYRADSSRAARGLGLGLSLVKAIVEAHGGRVAVSSTPGEGTRVSITLLTEGASSTPGGRASRH